MISSQQTPQRREVERLLAPIAELVHIAGERILEHAAAGLTARAKPDKSPVTEADEVAEEILIEGLARLVPGVPVVAEEAVARGGAGAGTSAFFLVDPIDGTREFVAGRAEYTVNVAFVSEHRPVLGIVHAPAIGTLYAGASGRAVCASAARGAPLRFASAKEIRVRPRPARLVAAVSRSHPDAASDAFLAALPVEHRLALGSSLKFARVAEGAADVYARLSRINEWDIAAGHALLTAAGGSVVGRDGDEVTYGLRERDLVVDGFIAWGGPPP